MGRDYKPEHLKKFFDTQMPGKSVRQIARECNLDFSFLAKILRNEANLTYEVVEHIARGFLLPLDEFEKYLRGEIVLDEFLVLAENRKKEIEKLRLVDFETDAPPAWQAVMLYAHDSKHGGDPFFRRVWVGHILAFMRLASYRVPVEFRYDRTFYYFLYDLCSKSQEEFVKWLDGLENNAHKRLVFHALLFTLYPLEYVIEGDGGILEVDKAVFFKGGDKYIKYPEFAYRFVREALAKQEQQ